MLVQYSSQYGVGYATQFQMSLSEHLIKNDDAKKLELQILFCRESSLLQHE